MTAVGRNILVENLIKAFPLTNMSREYAEELIDYFMDKPDPFAAAQNYIIMDGREEVADSNSDVPVSGGTVSAGIEREVIVSNTVVPENSKTALVEKLIHEFPNSQIISRAYAERLVEYFIEQNPGDPYKATRDYILAYVPNISNNDRNSCIERIMHAFPDVTEMPLSYAEELIDAFMDDTDPYVSARNYILSYNSSSNSLHKGLSRVEFDRLKPFSFHKSGRKDERCTICQMEYDEGDSVVFTPCFHRFHTECLWAWVKDNSICPVCKRDFETLNSGFTPSLL